MSCLFCQYGIPLLDVPIGKPGDPVGLCKNCSSMTCGWHGARTPPPAFICIVCDIDNLLASAGWDDFKAKGRLDKLPHGRGTGAAPGAPADPLSQDAAGDLARALAALFSTADGDPSLLVVATLAQWFDERPYYDGFRAALDNAVTWAIQVINQLFQTSNMGTGPGEKIGGHYDQRAVQLLWQRLGDAGRRLLAAAVLLIVTLDLPWDTLPPPVVDVAQLLGGRLRDFPNQLGNLRGQLTASRPGEQ
jgi:hypothetical protein